MSVSTRATASCAVRRGRYPYDPSSEIDERFRKCPWLFKKGNTSGAHRQKRSQVRLRMENLIQRLTDNGDVIVQFFCAPRNRKPSPRASRPRSRRREGRTISLRPAGHNEAALFLGRRV